MSPIFRTVALTLRDYISDSYQLLNAADAVVEAIGGENQTTTMEYTHDALVKVALASPEVMGFRNIGRSINAIKELRAITGCGLREAKEAVQDARLTQWLVAFGDPYANPVGTHHRPA